MAENNIHIDLLDRFMNGSTSLEEETILLEWFRDVRSKDEIFLFYKRKWEETTGKELSADVQGRMFHRIKRSVRDLKESGNKTVMKQVHSVSFNRAKWLPYVAAVLLCVFWGVGSYMYMERGMFPEAPLYVVSADKGQRATLILPDGTRAWLNSHTSITYNADYGKKEREVCLSGEAYFEVAKDKEHRFVVKAGEMEVEALGTAFNVKAYEEDEELTTTLFEGSVRATTGQNSAILSVDEFASFNKNTKRLRVSHAENSSYARMWRNNELAFEDETLEEISILLNRIYNVEVEFKSDKIKKYRFSGVIKNNSLDNVFEIISLTAPIIYESRGDTIILSEKR